MGTPVSDNAIFLWCVLPLIVCETVPLDGYCVILPT